MDVLNFNLNLLYLVMFQTQVMNDTFHIEDILSNDPGSIADRVFPKVDHSANVARIVLVECTI